MRDIIFSTTRQWNCGDEFILFGTLNILKNAIGEFNPLIYNRNPDIRPLGLSKGFRTLKFKRGYTQNKELCFLTSHLRIGFHDNSVKYDSDLSNASLAVFAGSPETFGYRNYNFFEHLIKYNIPLIALGIGWYGNVSEFEQDIYKKALAVTVRDKNLLKHDFLKNIGAVYIPCPALQSAPIEKEKKVTKIEKIALGLGVKLDDSVINACIDDGTYDFSINLYENLIQKYGQSYQFAIVCHYIDEVAIAHKLFDKYGLDIFYSFDAREYIDIYRKFDFVISPRVHACGMASSLGIPNINISHDNRAGTCAGFLSDFINLNTPLEDVFALFEKNLAVCAEKSEAILHHKHKAMNDYVQLLKNKLNFKKVHYHINLNKIPYLPAMYNAHEVTDLSNVSLSFNQTVSSQDATCADILKEIKIFGIPFLRIKRNEKFYKVLLFFRIPLFVIKTNKPQKFYLFGILPILKIS